jgi:hypothetical protein
MTAHPAAVNIDRSNMDCGNCLDIFYRNLWVLRQSLLKFLKMCALLNFKIICLTGTWIKESVSSQNFFQKFILHPDRNCHSKLISWGF